MLKLITATRLSENEIMHVLRYACTKFIKEAFSKSDALQQISDLKTFIRVNNRMYIYGVIDDDIKVTIKNFKRLYNNDIPFLNEQLGCHLTCWDDLQSTLPSILSSPGCDDIQKRMQMFIPSAHFKDQQQWLKSTFGTLEELNHEQDVVFEEWPVLSQIDGEMLLRKKKTQLEILKSLVVGDPEMKVEVVIRHLLRIIDKQTYVVPTQTINVGVEILFAIIASVSKLPVSDWYYWMLVYIFKKQHKHRFNVDVIATWVLEYKQSDYEAISADWGVTSYIDLCDCIPNTCIFDTFYALVCRMQGDSSIWSNILQGFTLYKTTPDGNCYFEAVAVALGDGSTVSSIRQRLSDALPTLSPENNEDGWLVYLRNAYKSMPPELQPTMTTLEELQRHVMCKTHWATDDDIKIVAYLYNVHFILVNRDGEFNCLGLTTTNADRFIILFYEHGVHYDLIQKHGQGVFCRDELPTEFFQSWLDTCGELDFYAPIHPL